MLNLCLIVAHGTDGQRGGIDLAALAPVPDFTVPVTFFAQAVPHPGVKLFALALRTEEAWVAAQHLVVAVAGDMAKSLVDVDDVGLRVGDGDAFARMAENAGGKQEFFVRQFSFGDFAKSGSNGWLAVVNHPGTLDFDVDGA